NNGGGGGSGSGALERRRASGAGQSIAGPGASRKRTGESKRVDDTGLRRDLRSDGGLDDGKAAHPKALFETSSEDDGQDLGKRPERGAGRPPLKIFTSSDEDDDEDEEKAFVKSPSGAVGVQDVEKEGRKEGEKESGKNKKREMEEAISPPSQGKPEAKRREMGEEGG
ncbi:hypothetical protein HK097_010246, partial [Rhizophlyctis rosea]